MEEHTKTPTKKKTHSLPWPSPSPSKKTTVYSDRFIPSRSVSARLDFSLLDREVAIDETDKAAIEREEVNSSYEQVIRNGILGASGLRTAASYHNHTYAAGTSNAASTPSNGRLFRYMSGDVQSPMAGPPPQSPFSRSLVDDNGPGPSPFTSPMKAAQRKISKAPIKVSHP